MNTQHRLCAYLCRAPRLVPLLTAVAAMHAQEPPPATTTTATSTTPSALTDDDVLVLSPFTVSSEKDTGYRATNTIGGTKMNTPIKDLPFSVDVVTQEFLRDTAAQSIDQALNYTAGINVSANAGNLGRTDYTLSIRGLPSNFFLRDGVAVYRQPDWTLIDRLEVIRGAAAIVYGSTQPGGVIQIITKKADVSRSFGSVEQTVGQWDNYVTRFDYNQPVIKGKLAVRLAGSYTSASGRRDFSHKEGRVFFPSATWRIDDKTLFTLQYTKENSKTRGNSNGLLPDFKTATRSLSYLDQNYEAYYNSLNPQQRADAGLRPVDVAIGNLQPMKDDGIAGGPSSYFLDDPWKHNISGKVGRWDQNQEHFIATMERNFVRKGIGRIEQSDLRVQFSRIDDKVRGILPLSDPQFSQGQRGAALTWAASAWNGNYGAQEWQFGSNYDGIPGNTPGEIFGAYSDYNEMNPGALNFAGSNFYRPSDLTHPDNQYAVPLAGPGSFIWYPMHLGLRNVASDITIDSITVFQLGKHTKLRTLFGLNYQDSSYYDASAHGDRPKNPSMSLAALASNYNRTGGGATSSTAWGPASSNPFNPGVPNWGYGFATTLPANYSDQQLSDYFGANPGTLYGAGADRKYRGWHIYNAQTGEHRGSQLDINEIAANVDQYFYELTTRTKSTAAYATGQLELFDNKLQLLGSVRYDRKEKWDKRTAAGGLIPYPNTVTMVFPQVGFVWNMNRNINLYGSYAKNSFDGWSRGANRIGEVPEPPLGKNIEFGSKFDFFGGRVSGSAALFQSTFEGLTWTDAMFDLTAYDGSRFPYTLDPLTGLQIHQYGLDRFTGRARSRGLELNVQYRPVKNWDIDFSYSRMKAILTDAAPWMVGLDLPGMPAHMASLWNKYSFNRENVPLLKGLEIGFGAVYNSPTYIGKGFNQARLEGQAARWRTPVFIRYDAMIAYNFKLLKRECRAQINAKNLANRVNWTADGNYVPDGQGREFIGTLSLKF